MFPAFPLPTHTFFFGPPDKGQLELAAAICSRDDSLVPCDFEEPLRNATQQLFFGGFSVDRDLLDPIERKKPVLLNHTPTVAQWLSHLHRNLDEFFGEPVLGEIAVADYMQSFTLGDRILWRDLHNAKWLIPFLRFSRHELFVINLGEFHEWSVPHCTLYSTGTASRLVELAEHLDAMHGALASAKS